MLGIHMGHPMLPIAIDFYHFIFCTAENGFCKAQKFSLPELFRKKDNMGKWGEMGEACRFFFFWKTEWKNGDKPPKKSWKEEWWFPC